MRLICFWCCALLAADALREDDFYTPQTFAQVEPYRQQQLFSPGGAGRAGDVSAQGTVVPTWKAGPAPPAPAYDGYSNYRGGEERRPEPWRLPYGLSKEQQATILHHKQSLSSEGAFRFEYASDNGLSAGEVIEPDGSRVGAYQYKDPSGQLVKLKYRAGKEGFQILEGSHLPKSPEPVAPPAANDYNTAAYEQQRRQFELQQNYNQQREQRPPWHAQEGRGGEEGSAAGGAGGGAGGQYYSGWRPEGRDDGQYRDNDIDEASRGPHSFGEGYAFAFKG